MPPIKPLVYIAVFLFPILVATVNHGGSIVYLLLLLLGLLIAWPAWCSLESWEKKVLLGFALFFILLSVSFLNAQDFYNGIKKLEKYLLFPLVIPIYLLVKKYQIETGKVFLLGVICASFILSWQAYIQTFNLEWWRRAYGAYHPIIFGDISMLVAVFIACALITVATNWWHYVLGFLAIGLALSASVMSGSRGAWLLLPVIAVWFLWLKRERLSGARLVSIIIVSFLLVWSFLSIETVQSRVSSLVDEYHNNTRNPSARLRLELWRDSITIWESHPIIGTGVGDYKMDVKQLINDGRSNSLSAFGHAHNIYFNALAISGLVGLFALLFFVQLIPFLMFRSFWKKEQDPWIQFYALSGMATIIAFAVFGLTEDWLARNPFVRTYLMSILVFMSSISIRREVVGYSSLVVCQKTKD